jgi:AAA domain/Bifunctional DNA primase/polymerase, N-terminal
MNSPSELRPRTRRPYVLGESPECFVQYGGKTSLRFPLEALDLASDRFVIGPSGKVGFSNPFWEYGESIAPIDWADSERVTAPDLARSYIRRGWAPIPVPFGTKVPTLVDWPNLRITSDTVAEYFNGKKQNIGILLGVPSGNLIDIDLDCFEAVTLAANMLPTTASIFGRASKPRSHFLFVADAKVDTKKYSNPIKREDGSTETLVELRSTGAQTVFPGSTHETGETIEWAVDHARAKVTAAELQKAVARLAVACLAKRFGTAADGDLLNADDSLISALTGAPEKVREIARAWLGLPPEEPRNFWQNVNATVGNAPDPFWKNVNTTALQNLESWVRSLFPRAKFQPGTGAWRVSSRDLGRKLQEDLSLHPRGIHDFGKEVPLTAIDTVIEFGEAADAKQAALWLCERIGIAPENLGYRAGNEAEGDVPPQADEFLFHWHGDVDPNDSRPWLVQDLIPEVGSGLVSGQWGTYKTFMVLDLGHSVMTGTPFLDFEVMRPGGVLFIALEGANEVAIRLQGVIDHKGKLVKAPFVWIETCPPLINKNAVSVLSRMAERAAAQLRERFDLPLSAIFIDTVVAGAGYTKDGQENDAASNQAMMRTLAQVARNAGCFVFGVDHFGKNVDTGTRGSSTKEGAADVVLVLLGDKNVAGEVTNTRLAIRKRRGGSNGAEFPFKPRVVDMGTDKFGVQITTLVLDWGAKDEAPKAAKDRWSAKNLKLLRQTIMRLMVDCGVEIRPWADGPTVRALDSELVKREFYKSHITEGQSEKAKRDARWRAFKRATDDAQGKKLIEVRELGGVTYLWLVDPNEHD